MRASQKGLTLNLFFLAGGLPLYVLGGLDHAGDQRVGDDRQKDQTHSPGQQRDQRTIALRQRLAEAGISGAAKDQAQSQGRQRNVELAQVEAFGSSAGS